MFGTGPSLLTQLTDIDGSETDPAGVESNNSDTHDPYSFHSDDYESDITSVPSPSFFLLMNNTSISPEAVSKPSLLKFSP